MKTEPPPVSGDFVTEGTFLALPVAFPGVSRPVGDEHCQLHRLCLSPGGGTVYAAARGPQPHLFQFAPKGTFGYAVDLGVEDGEEIVALVARPAEWSDQLLVAVRTEGGTRLIERNAAAMSTGIQEWQVGRSRAHVLLDLAGVEPRDLLLLSDGLQVALLGGGMCRLYRWTENALEPLAEVVVPANATGLIGDSSSGLMIVVGDKGDFLRIGEDGDTQAFRVEGFDGAGAWARHPAGLVWADADGRIMEWTLGEAAARLRGRVRLTPVHALARLPDGRIFVSAGADIAHWYVLEEGCDWGRDLGVPVSTLSTRRYGFQFADLLVGRDGEIYAAEDDRGGHLWIYFPPVR